MLFSKLAKNGITKEEATKIFGRSHRTLKRWNENPPDHILKLIDTLGDKPPFPQQWKGWYFDRQFLVDPAGNAFHINEVSTIFWTRQLTEGLTGNKSNISSLKLELENKIQRINSKITITVHVGDQKRVFDVAL